MIDIVAVGNKYDDDDDDTCTTRGNKAYCDWSCLFVRSFVRPFVVIS